MVVKMWLAKRKLKGVLLNAFRLAGIGLTYKNGNQKLLIPPKVHAVEPYPHKIVYVFTLPNGLDPQELLKRQYIFRQVFGGNVILSGDNKRFVLAVYVDDLPKRVTYNYETIKPKLDDYILPIVCGKTLDQDWLLFDLAKLAHVLLSGETGSGKSSLFHAILCTLIQHASPDEVQLYLCDLKRSEMGIYRNVQHVKSVSTTAEQFLPHLRRIKAEMQRRGDLLDKHGVNNLDSISEKPPRILVCVDEFALLKKEEEALEIIEEISCIGRSLWINLVLAIQRPDSKAFNGALKNNLKARISGRQSDAINAGIADTPGAEKLSVEIPGRMLVKLDGLTTIQAPYLSDNKAKKLLEPYKVKPPETKPVEAPAQLDEPMLGVLSNEKA